MTDEQTGRFLDELSFSGNVAFACAAAGVPLATAFRERRIDAIFERDWRDAQTRARAALRRRLFTPA